MVSHFPSSLRKQFFRDEGAPQTVSVVATGETHPLPPTAHPGVVERVSHTSIILGDSQVHCSPPKTIPDRDPVSKIIPDFCGYSVQKLMILCEVYGLYPIRTGSNQLYWQIVYHRVKYEYITAVFFFFLLSSVWYRYEYGYTVLPGPRQRLFRNVMTCECILDSCYTF